MRPLIPQSQEDRIRLIGDLLCKGILRSQSLRSEHGAPAIAGMRSAEPEQRILDYLRRHESASPAEMRAVLNLSRTRTNLALQRLLLSQQIARTGGRTSAAAYRLMQVDPSRN